MPPHNTIGDVTQAFFRIEQELDLFDMEQDGLYPWESLRYPLFQEIVAHLGLQAPVWQQSKAQFSRRLRVLRYLFISLFLRNPFFARKGAILLIGHGRRKHEGGRYVDMYTDPLTEIVGTEEVCETFEPSWGTTVHMVPPSTKNLRYLDWIQHLSRVFERIWPVRLTPQTLEKLRMAQSALKNELNSEINLAPIVRKELSRLRAGSAIYRLLLKHLSPRAVLLVVSGHKEPLILAARDLGIPTAELQHGSPAQGKLGYHFPDNVYKRAFPDRFFSFGSYWNAPLPLPRQNIRNIGFAYLDRERRKHAGVQRKPQIIVISQTTIGPQLAKFTAALAKMAPPNVEFVFKLHPGEIDDWKERYGFLSDVGVRVSADRKEDLYQLLAESTWQLGVYSTALYEGIAFGCQTFILKAPGYETMLTLMDKGMATLVEEPGEVDFEEAASTPAADYLFAPVTTENLLAEIRSLVDGR